MNYVLGSKLLYGPIYSERYPLPEIRNSVVWLWNGIKTILLEDSPKPSRSYESVRLIVTDVCWWPLVAYESLEINCWIEKIFLRQQCDITMFKLRWCENFLFTSLVLLYCSQFLTMQYLLQRFLHVTFNDRVTRAVIYIYYLLTCLGLFSTICLATKW